MPAIITNKFRVHNQEQFVESFTETAKNIYYTIDDIDKFKEMNTKLQELEN